MGKLDWKKVEDYDYTVNLDTSGWAWEFLRRSDRYRAAHAKGDASQAILWNLKKLYSPYEVYHSGIEFMYVNQHPLFFCSPGGKWDYLGIQQLKKFPEIHPLEELSDRLRIYSDTILIAFDTSLPLDHQITKSKNLLLRYQAERPFVNDEDTKVHPDKLQRQLRILDAISSNDVPSQAAIIRIIHPDKKWPSISANPEDKIKNKKDVGYDLATPQQIAAYAHDVFKQAQHMADEGYQKFLVKLSQGL